MQAKSCLHSRKRNENSSCVGFVRITELCKCMRKSLSGSYVKNTCSKGEIINKKNMLLFTANKTYNAFD